MISRWNEKAYRTYSVQRSETAYFSGSGLDIMLQSELQQLRLTSRLGTANIVGLTSSDMNVTSSAENILSSAMRSGDGVPSSMPVLSVHV